VIRISRTLGHCATCGSGNTYWPATTVTPTLILRITASGRSGAGGTVDVCEHHARQLVISPDFADANCTSCGHRGAVQVVGPVERKRYAIAVCRARCAAGLAGRIGEAVTLADGESTEWTDDFVPPSWWSSDALANRKAGGR